MSLFGGLMGDLEDDPFFGGQMRRMNNMMNSMMSDFFSPPFGNMLSLRGAEMVDPYQQQSREVARRGQDFGMGLMPMGFGFPNIGAMFNNMATNDNCHSFSSSTVMTMTSGPDGRPQVYQASTSSRKAPGGICETKKTVADSRTGVKKMAIGHHIGERAHVMERKQNLYSGEQEQNEEYINLDEEEAEDFNKEWESKTRTSKPAIGYGNSHYRHHHHHHNNRRHRGESAQVQLALPPAPTSNTSSSLPRYSSRQTHRPQYLQLLPATSSTCHKSEKTEIGKKRKQHHDNPSKSGCNDQIQEKNGSGNEDGHEPKLKKKATVSSTDKTCNVED